MSSPETLGALYKSLKFGLKAIAPDSADLEARWILQERLNASWADMVGAPDSEVPLPMAKIIRSDLALRRSGKPLSRIYGRREFWGMDFTLNEATLDPRPDSETLVRAVLARKPERTAPLHILDLGTGTGCLLLALLSEYTQARGIGIDLSPRALQAAQDNATRHDLHSRADFAAGSWFEATPDGAQFDIIVSNPPYIAESVIPELALDVQNHDPILALAGGTDGLDAYKNIFSGLGPRLKRQGRAFFEIGFDQAESVMRLARNAGFYVEAVFPDSAGLARVVEIRHGDKS